MGGGFYLDAIGEGTLQADDDNYTRYVLQGCTYDSTTAGLLTDNSTGGVASGLFDDDGVTISLTGSIYDKVLDATVFTGTLLTADVVGDFIGCRKARLQSSHAVYSGYRGNRWGTVRTHR